MASEAAKFISPWFCPCGCMHIPMPLSLSVVELLFVLAFSSFGVMVDVDVDREKVFAKGARCVSLSSSNGRVSNNGLQYL